MRSRMLFLAVLFSLSILFFNYRNSRVQRAAAPKRLIMITMARRPRGSLFEGLAPHPRFVALGNQPIPPRRSCRQTSGFILRATDFLGITSTVYAQSDCSGSTCLGCYTLLRSATCTGNDCGTYSYAYPMGELQRAGSTNMCPNCYYCVGCSKLCKFKICSNNSCN